MNLDHKKLIQTILFNDKSMTEEVADNYNHSYVTPSHIFMAFNTVARFLTIKDTTTLTPEHRTIVEGISREYPTLKSFLTEDIISLFEKYNNLKTKYGITPNSLKDAFIRQCPKGESFSATKLSHPEVTSLVDILNRLHRQKGYVTINDLYLELVLDIPKNNRTVNTENGEMIRELLLMANGDSQTNLEKFIKESRKLFIDGMVKPVSSFKELDEYNFMRNLNKYIQENPKKIYDMKKITDEILVDLSCVNVSSAIITGKAGCGKTDSVLDLARRINEGDVPDEFKNCVIYSLDSNALMGGTRFRGELEERLNNLLQFISKHKEVILFIDEIHAIVKMGATSDDNTGIGDILKPYLSNGEIRVIGATTEEEYTKHILRSKAFARRFHKVQISEPNKERTKTILEDVIVRLGKHFGNKPTPEVIDKILEYSDRYSLETGNPAKSIKMLETAMAYNKMFKPDSETVTLDDLRQAMAMRHNINISEDRYQATVDALNTEILGQKEAIDKVLEAVELVDLGIVDKTKPLMTLMLTGPSGVGKTETAKIIAREFFGNENNIIIIPCADYKEKHDISKLTGAAPSYVGYDDDTKILKEIKEKSSCVVCIDEIEKAHPEIFDVFLNMMENGVIVDNKGDDVSFRNAIVIFTTNIGTDHNTGKETGAGFIKKTNTAKSNLSKALKDKFRPEFLGRIDEIITFDTLPDDVYDKIIDKFVKVYLDNIDNPIAKNIKLKPENYENIKKNADTRVKGAREFKTYIKKEISKILKEQRENSKEKGIGDLCDIS